MKMEDNFLTTILWIEDEIHNMLALDKMLNKRGINIVKARSKSEAIEKLSSSFDLILLDLILPLGIQDPLLNTYKPDICEPYENLAGLSILRMLRKESCSVPIFVFTIVNDVEIRNEIEKHKVSYYYKGTTKITTLCDHIVKAIEDKCY
jgi:CheY-like chemotaxis protein